MRAFIIDDERLARNGLRRLLAAHPDVEIAGEAANAEDGVVAVRTCHPDLLFLDIELPDADGFQLLKGLDPVPSTIFTTAYDTHALRAFEANALDYLVKPIRPERLEACLVKARALHAARGPSASVTSTGLRSKSSLHSIFISDGGRCWLLRLADVLVMESEGNYTRVHFGAGCPLVLRALGAIEARLNPDEFFRANRSQIVNLRKVDHVVAATDGHLVLTLAKGRQVDMSRRQSQRLRRLLSL